MKRVGSGRSGMHHIRLLCSRCSSTLVPSWTGQRCPRMAACGFGGLIESLGLHSGAAFTSRRTEA